DHDSADDEREADDANEYGEDAVRRGLIDADDGVGREHAEVIRLLRLEPPRATKGDGRFVLRRDHLRHVVRLHRQLERPPGTEQHVELAERNDRERVLRLAEHRPFFLADADDPKVHALDLYDLVDRVDVLAEQAIGRLPPENGHRAIAVYFRGTHHAP